MATKLEENAKLREMIDTLETAKNDLQVGKNNIANILGSPFTGNDKLDTTKNTLNSIRSTFVSNLNKKGVSTASNTPFKTLAENIGKIEQGNMRVPIWYTPKNVTIDGAYDSNIKNETYASSVDKDVFFILYIKIDMMYFRKYDTTTNSLSSLMMSEHCSNFLLISYNEEIYRIGGINGSVGLNTCQKYNTKTMTWSFVPNMITGRFGTCGEIYNNQIHVLYGRDKAANTYTNNISEYFSINTNTWTSKGQLQSSKGTTCKCAKGDYNFIIYGASDPSDIYRVVIVNYNPITGTISGRYGTSSSFAVPIKNYMYLGNYDYYSTGNYTGLGIGENGKIFERFAGKTKIPSDSNIRAVSMDGKFIYYCIDNYVKCFIPEL
ncbi:Kelch repeat-containing protein [Clostridioides difficile]|uniref:kelch repeat-containing protein n=1 Tax=Clostridioides difficile TaxID=1496 RepID=UPI00374F9CD4